MDGASNGDTGRWGVGGVICNHQGNWILGFMQAIPQSTPIVAELRSLLKGLQVARDHRLSLLEVHTNSQEMVHMFKNGNIRYDSLISQCRYLIETIDQVVLRHVYKKVNQVVDVLAKEGSK